jgi:ketosteroid isomerase-like protein
MTLIERVREYLLAIEQNAITDPLDFYTPDVEQIEYPNRFLPQGATRDLTAIQEAGERGKAVMASQRFEIVNAVEQGDLVAVEFIWTGTLKVPIGSLQPGDEMLGHYAMFVEFREGKIAKLRNYDCFDPF